MGKAIALAALFIISCTVLPAQQKASGAIKDTAAYFDAYVQRAIADWEIPGLAISVVKDGNVRFRKVYGVRSLNTKAKADHETLFACASTTKAMTAFAMGILVDRNKVSWDDKVTKYIPDFTLYDPYVTVNLTIRDLFLHNSGYGNTDYLWTFNDLPGDAMISSLRYIKPAYPYRTSFVYQNIFYHIAGKVIEVVSGVSLAEFMTVNVFSPLGMQQTKAMGSLIHTGNVAMPHYRINGKVEEIQRSTADRLPAAGAVYSSIDDITKWMQCMLDSGKYAGGRLISAKTWVNLLKPQTLIPVESFFPTAQITKPNFTTYALGWFQQDYKGEKLNFHTGSLIGEVAIHGQIPDRKTGVYIFANLDHAEARHALMLKALDLYALGESRDWEMEFLALYKTLGDKGDSAKRASLAVRVPNTNPSKEIGRYAGTYKDPVVGSIQVQLVNGQLIASNVQLGKGTLTHHHYDTYLLEWQHKWHGKSLVQFTLSPAGEVNALQYEGFLLRRQ